MGLAPAVALSPAARALAVQQLMDGPAPANLGQTIHLSVKEPIGADGAAFGYNGARYVWPTMSMAVFDSTEADAALTISAPNWPAGLKLFDCAVTGVDAMDWALGYGPQTTGGQSPLTDGHLIFVVSTTPGQQVSISATGGQSWYLRWCDITRIN